MTIRKFKDIFLQAITYGSSLITLIILSLILGFVIIQGKDTLNLEMLTQDYWSENLLVDWEVSNAQEFDKPSHLGTHVAFSKKYGIGFEDAITSDQQDVVRVVYIDETSPFLDSKNATQGEGFGKPLVVSLGDSIQKIDGYAQDGSVVLMGKIFGDTAETLVSKLDSTIRLETLYYQTPGGGIWGSLIATLLLIVMSLFFALPIGIFAAVYLTEIAKPSILTSFIERSVEMLAGVPSIVFGLMGVVVLYPVVSLFNVSGLSILLGSLTLSIMLLPVIIRSVQESLLIVPQDFRLASLSLGASQTQTIFKVVLPSALPGILAAILLAVGRIVGESAALIYTMGTFINDKPTLQTGATSLAVHIWSIMSQDQPNFKLASAISLIILIIMLVLNVSLKVVTSRLHKKLGV